MQIYRPYLIHRVECHYDPDSPGMGALCSYDYMGSSEFEFGAVGRANGRVRRAIERGVEFVIVKIPLNVPVSTPWGKTHDAIYALMTKYALDSFGVAEFQPRVQMLVEGKLQTKEHCDFGGKFSMWQDLEESIYYSFNSTFLHLIYCTLARDIGFAKKAHLDISIGDTLSVAKVLNGKAIHSVSHMETKTGKVVGILDNSVVIKDYKKYRMPFEYILTHDIKFLAPYEVVSDAN